MIPFSLSLSLSLTGSANSEPAAATVFHLQQRPLPNWTRSHRPRKPSEVVRAFLEGEGAAGLHTPQVSTRALTPREPIERRDGAPASSPTRTEAYARPSASEAEPAAFLSAPATSCMAVRSRAWNSGPPVRGLQRQRVSECLHEAREGQRHKRASENGPVRASVGETEGE